MLLPESGTVSQAKHGKAPQATLTLTGGGGDLSLGPRLGLYGPDAQWSFCRTKRKEEQQRDTRRRELGLPDTVLLLPEVPEDAQEAALITFGDERAFDKARKVRCRVPDTDPALELCPHKPGVQIWASGCAEGRHVRTLGLSCQRANSCIDEIHLDSSAA